MQSLKYVGWKVFLSLNNMWEIQFLISWLSNSIWRFGSNFLAFTRVYGIMVLICFCTLRRSNANQILPQILLFSSAGLVLCGYPYKTWLHYNWVLIFFPGIMKVVRSGDLVSYCAEEGVRILGEGKFLVSDSFPGNERTKYCLTSKVI